MPDRLLNVLFLCTANSARSVLSEAILNHLGQDRFQAYSAGSQPAGAVNPIALRLLAAKGLSIAGLRSKSWDEFASAGAAPMDFIFTVCDNAAGEACPFWPGKPASAHWGIPDPAGVSATDANRLAAFEQAYERLHRRISAFIALPVETMAPAELRAALQPIGQQQDVPA